MVYSLFVIASDSEAIHLNKEKRWIATALKGLAMTNIALLN
jgi:hypothetical protein